MMGACMWHVLAMCQMYMYHLFQTPFINMIKSLQDTKIQEK